MPPTSDLNPVAQVFERLFIRAWDLFDDDKDDDVQFPLCIAFLFRKASSTDC
jgi:hypothetical protein